MVIISSWGVVNCSFFSDFSSSEFSNSDDNSCSFYFCVYPVVNRRLIRDFGTIVLIFDPAITIRKIKRKKRRYFAQQQKKSLLVKNGKKLFCVWRNSNIFHLSIGLYFVLSYLRN